jgi:SAM-dependent MidA family methyltransferase
VIPATDLIRNAVRARGPISFFDFMGLALYAPGSGYYENPGRVGRGGDFFTSVSVGPLFGELLALRFREWLSALETEVSAPVAPVFQLVEVGANDGRLAADVLRAWNPLPAGRPVELVLVEPSTRRREWQRATLAEVAGPPVRWVKSLEELGPIHGILYSNELLDALPVHRVGWDRAARRWFEWGVEERGEGFGWVRLEGKGDSAVLSDVHLQLAPELAEVLPDGFCTEIHSEARRWWSAAAASLGSGWLVALDYGLRGEEFFSPRRTEGTLRAYAQHRLLTDLLAHPGEQDLTAHVNFTACEAAGLAAGLRTAEWASQAKFLTGIASPVWNDPKWTGWNTSQVAQFKTLTHPEHLGRSFQVLVQRR